MATGPLLRMERRRAPPLPARSSRLPASPTTRARGGASFVISFSPPPARGGTGQGDGFNAFSLDPRPRDLADPAFQATKSDDDLAAIIRSGGGVAGMSTAMPPYGRTLNERRIR